MKPQLQNTTTTFLFRKSRPNKQYAYQSINQSIYQSINTNCMNLFFIINFLLIFLFRFHLHCHYINNYMTYGTRRFNFGFTKALQLSILLYEPIQFLVLATISLKSFLIVSSHLSLSHPRVLKSQLLYTGEITIDGLLLTCGHSNAGTSAEDGTGQKEIQKR